MADMNGGRGVRYADQLPNKDFPGDHHGGLPPKPASSGTARSSILKGVDSGTSSNWRGAGSSTGYGPGSSHGFGGQANDHGDEQQNSPLMKCSSFDFGRNKLGEIFKKTLAAIDEHKDIITVEYKNLKRELDIERGNMRSEVKLSRKERRSKKHIEQLEKAEYSMKKAHINKLHEVLMKHHFSLANVEDGCIQALRDECLDYVRSLNKTELGMWKRTCQDFHETMDLPVKGFTIKAKWKRLQMIIDELKSILEEGMGNLTNMYNNSGIRASLIVHDRATWKSKQYLQDTFSRIDEQSELKKKVLVRLWAPLSEEIKENLNKQTQLIKFDHKHRLETMANECSNQLRDMQQQSARRHGRLMQKVAREQELLDRERTDMKSKHGERKARSKRRHRERESDNQPPQNKPSLMNNGIGGAMGNFGGMGNMMGGMGGGMGGMPGMGGMGGMGGMPGMGGYGGGMGNYNMSNAVDVRTCSTLSSGEITQQPSPTSQSPTYRGNVTDTLTSHTTNRTATPRDAAEKPYEHRIFPASPRPAHPIPLIKLIYRQSSLYPTTCMQAATLPAFEPLEDLFQLTQLPVRLEEVQPDFDITPVNDTSANTLEDSQCGQVMDSEPKSNRKIATVSVKSKKIPGKKENRKLSSSMLKRMPRISKSETLDNFFLSIRDHWNTTSHQDHQEPDVSTKIEVNHNANYGGAQTGEEAELYPGEDNRNVNADSSSSSDSDDSSSDSESEATSSKSGKSGGSGKSGKSGASDSTGKKSLAQRLFGIGGSKKSTEGDKTTFSDKSGKSGTSSSGKTGSKSPATSKGKSAKTKGDKSKNEESEGEAMPARRDDYKEFVPNEHKDKWTFKRIINKICFCCDCDKIIKKICPCFKSRYEEYKEKREERKEKKAMQKNVLLRLRDEANKSKNM